MVKRAFDIAVASIALVALAPLLLFISLAVVAALGRPALFRQVRPGLRGRPFALIKFRTMRHTCDASGRLLPDEQRLTRLGRWLRASSLDELPELWNVVRGDMSLVGPRPLLMEYLQLYTAEQARRGLVRPGLTGLAQVRGRNAISWEEKFALDVWYVDNRSMALDLRILGETLLHLVRPRGISAAGYATMPPFTGSPAKRRREVPSKTDGGDA